jgi:hypothetical protein
MPDVKMTERVRISQIHFPDRTSKNGESADLVTFTHTGDDLGANRKNPDLGMTSRAFVQGRDTRRNTKRTSERADKRNS